MHGKEILNIKRVPGSKGVKDQKILVENKPLSIRDLLILVRFMSENEKRINAEKIARNDRFFFGEAIMAATFTEKEIDRILEETLTPDKGGGLIK